MAKYKIKGRIVKDTVSYQGERREVILLRTKTYEEIEIDEPKFGNFIGCKMKITIKY